uniref:Uncharacterized protein n=1 Tax=Panagrolaimus sp. PS1159 TaxID=55785 RepID=A0AC35FZY3_9BILA
MLRIFLLLTIAGISFINGQINGSNTVFTCMHGEGYFEKSNISTKFLPCPSQKCILFYTYCDEYWATTCYNERKPNLIFANFKAANNLSKRRRWLVMHCNQTECNKHLINYPYGTYFEGFIRNFDNELWPNLKQSKFNRLLKNSIKIKNGLERNETLEGKVAAVINSKVWFDLEFQLPDGSFYIDKSTLPKNGTLKWNLTFEYINDTFQVNSLNGIIKTLNLTKISNGNANATKLTLIQYGGSWLNFVIQRKSKISANLTETLLFEPMFDKVSNINFRQNISQFKPSSNIKYEETSKYLDTNNTKITVPALLPIEPYGSLVMEFRENLLPNSNLIKMETYAIRNGNESKYFLVTEIHKRINNEWIKILPGQGEYYNNCTKFNFEIYKRGYARFSCETNAMSYFNVDGFDIAKYVVQSIRKKFICFY